MTEHEINMWDEFINLYKSSNYVIPEIFIPSKHLDLDFKYNVFSFFVKINQHLAMFYHKIMFWQLSYDKLQVLLLTKFCA